MWETDPMNSKQFVDTYAIDTDVIFTLDKNCGGGFKKCTYR